MEDTTQIQNNSDITPQNEIYFLVCLVEDITKAFKSHIILLQGIKEVR